LNASAPRRSQGSTRSSVSKSSPSDLPSTFRHSRENRTGCTYPCPCGQQVLSSEAGARGG
jgi:hypothetical protein